MTRMINLVRDYDSAEGVDDESPNLAVEASASQGCLKASVDKLYHESVKQGIWWPSCGYKISYD